MKKFKLSLLAFCISFYGFAQVYLNAIPNASTSISNNSVLLEFQPNVNRGIILPWNSQDVMSPVNGTFILNANTKSVKAYNNGVWLDLSNGAAKTNSIDSSLQKSPYLENPNAKVVIGELSTAPDGILVLESTNKAMVLPYVSSPEKNIGNPAPGLMVFDPTTEMVCVFNGTEWSYWSAK